MSDEMQVQTKGINKKFIFIAIALIAVGLVAALVLLIPTSAKAKKVEEQLDLGAKYLSELDYEQAIVAYEAVIKIEPKCEEAYLALADIYIATGAFDKAEEILKRAEEEIGADVTDAISSKKKEVEKVRVEQKVTESVPSLTLAPTATLTNMPSTTPAVELLPINQIITAEIGDVVKFGRFFQTQYVDLEEIKYEDINRDSWIANMDEIEWYVLDRKDDKVLLFSKYVLDTKPYHNDSSELITWKHASLREWLNNTFYNFAFSKEEKHYICKTKLSNPDNAEWGTEGGVATIDNVFLLSIEEAKKYFNFTYDSSSNEGFEEYSNSELDERLIGIVTNYAWINGSGGYAVEDSEDCSNWWYLRSMGRNNKVPAIVEPWGYVNAHGYSEFTVDVPNGIRPAIWVDITDDSSEGDIFDLTDGKDDDEDVRMFHSLKADPENLLSFDEITFLGHNIVNLDIDTAQRLLEENNYSVTTNLEWENPDETDHLWISGEQDIGWADVSAIQYFTEDHVAFWGITQFTHCNETKTPVGTRNINMHDTFGEVFEKIGFDNAYEVEADIEYCFEQVFLNDGEMGEKDWSIFSSMIDYGKWSQGFSVGHSGIGWTEEQDEKRDYNFSIILSDAPFQEPNMDKNYSLHLEFDRDENTNGKFILTDYHMSVDKEP